MLQGERRWKWKWTSLSRKKDCEVISMWQVVAVAIYVEREMKQNIKASCTWAARSQCSHPMYQKGDIFDARQYHTIGTKYFWHHSDVIIDHISIEEPVKVCLHNLQTISQHNSLQRNSKKHPNKIFALWENVRQNSFSLLHLIMTCDHLDEKLDTSRPCA